MNDIEELLRALAEDSGDENADDSGGSCQCDEQSGTGGLFSGLDPEMLIKMLSLFEALNQPDDNERFLLALKPLLRRENQEKIDSAIRLIKLFSILPLLKDSGMLNYPGGLL